MDSTDKKAIRGYFGKDMDVSSSSEDEDDDNNSRILNVRNIADTVIFISWIGGKSGFLNVRS